VGGRHALECLHGIAAVIEERGGRDAVAKPLHLRVRFKLRGESARFPWGWALEHQGIFQTAKKPFHHQTNPNRFPIVVVFHPTQLCNQSMENESEPLFVAPSWLLRLHHIPHLTLHVHELAQDANGNFDLCSDGLFE
jgi:hypothetical protein